MKRKSSVMRKYLLNCHNEDVSVKTKITWKALLNECCCDYEETDDSGKLKILKDILCLLMQLVFNDDDVRIEMGQFYIANQGNLEKKHDIKIS